MNKTSSSMILGEILRMAFASIGVNKLRSILTMLGIAIGVFSVIGVMTAVTALRSSIETGLSFLGTNMFQFAKYPAGIHDDGASRRKYEMRRNISLAQALRYKQLMEASGSSDVVCLKSFLGAAQAVYNARKTTPNLSFGGSNEHFTTANQFSVETGRNLNPEDVELARPVAVIGLAVVKKLFPAENPLGKRIKVAGRTYTVVGTYADKGSSFGQDDNGIVMIPITRFLDDFGAEGRSINIATQAPSQLLYNATMDRAVTMMRIARGLRPEQENDFEVYSNDSLLASFAKIADVVRSGALVISAIALLAAGVGIMNIMLVSVTERTKEIGIRKSIGARRMSIMVQFLVESVTISIAGGLIGIVLGIAGGNGLALMMHASVVLPWTWALIGLVVCSGIGIGFGFYPAWKAARLDPIEALRFE